MEINAAWGQAALLLCTIATRVGYRFKRYRIIPMGSYSKIAVANDERSTYELYSSGGTFTGFWARNFNDAMQAFLVCLKELGDYAEHSDPEVGLLSVLRRGERQERREKRE